MIQQADPTKRRHGALQKARSRLDERLQSSDRRILVRFITVSGSHRYEDGTQWFHQEVIRILDVQHWPTLAWNTVHHHLAQHPESRGWSAKDFFEATATYAHQGPNTRRSFVHALNPQGTPPRPLWYEHPSDQTKEDAFPMVTSPPHAVALEEPIAAQLEG